jgi:hypothetical protein
MNIAIPNKEAIPTTMVIAISKAEKFPLRRVSDTAKSS